MVQSTQILEVRDSWQSVPLNGAASISITLEAPYKEVKVRISNTPPAPGEKGGNTITAVDRSVVITDLTSGQMVWVRTIGDVSTIAYQ